MIYIGFALNNPLWRYRFKNLWNRCWIISKNKNLELEFYKDSAIFASSFSFGPFSRDHGGFDFSIALFGYCFSLNFYDIRHWDHENNTWTGE
jgi:hypothetical protein